MTKQELYNKAKEAYYSGAPIMSDAEFDELEKEVGVGAVGAVDKDAKFFHPTRMLSLSKYQADKTTGEAPSIEAKNWMVGTGAKEFYVTCKYDGNSGNVVYENGKLKMVISRGDGIKGRDITSKIINKIPKTISKYNEGVLEIRGELIMPNSVFKAKYEGRFANPRNMVAGLLGRDEDEGTDDIEFVAYDGKYEGEYLTIRDINSLGFNSKYKPFEKVFKITDDFDELFAEMVELRKNSEFPLDGFVLKTPVEYRGLLGENDHDPEWGKAIKFKPEGAITTVENISWSMGKSGEFTPIAILKGVDLDGSIVKRACLYNAGYVKNYGIKKGTKVRIVKAGDIIPQIVEVF